MCEGENVTSQALVLASLDTWGLLWHDSYLHYKVTKVIEAN